MPGPLGAFLVKKNSKQDCYLENRCDMVTTSKRDLISTLSPKGKRGNNSRKSFPLYTVKQY